MKGSARSVGARKFFFPKVQVHLLLRCTPFFDQVKVPVGQAKMNEDGNIVPGRTIDMVVEGQNVYIVRDDAASAINNNKNISDLLARALRPFGNPRRVRCH